MEEWLKRSYKGEGIEAAFRPWFNADGSEEPRIIAVAKRRALRKIRIDSNGKPLEVSQTEFPTAP